MIALSFAELMIRDMFKDNKELIETLDEQKALEMAAEVALAQETELSKTYAPAPSYPTPSPYKKYW